MSNLKFRKLSTGEINAVYALLLGLKFGDLYEVRQKAHASSIIADLLKDLHPTFERWRESISAVPLVRENTTLGLDSDRTKVVLEVLRMKQAHGMEWDAPLLNELIDNSIAPYTLLPEARHEIISRVGLKE